MMQEEWDDCSLFLFLWGKRKKSLKLPGETRIDETKRTRATCCARGGACWSKEGEAFPISMPETSQAQAAPTHSFTHSLTHTTNTTPIPPQPARGTIARPQEVPAPGGQGGSS